MTAFVVGSDARVTSPTFVDLDGLAAATDATPTLAVVSARTGETLAAPTVTASGTTGVYQATLTAATHLAEVDRLSLTWAGEVDSAARSLSAVVDVAGGVYVTTTELSLLRTVPQSGSSLDSVRFWRDSFEALAEEARGVAYVPRLAVETRPGSGLCRLMVGHRQVRSVVSIEIDGTAQSLTDVTGTADGYIDAPFAFPAGASIAVVYEHGYDAPPGALVAACREYVRSKLLAETSDQGRNVIAFTNLATGEQFRYGTADWSAGRFTGLEDVDALIRSVPDERFVGIA